MARTSSPSMESDPAVGSISRVMQRTRVDLPEPDRPMTTNTSPLRTSKVTSRTAAVQPVRSRSSAAGSEAYSESGTRTALRCGPKTFHSPSTEKTGEPVPGTAAPVEGAFTGSHRPAADQRLSRPP